MPLKEPALGKPELVEKLLVCSQSSNSLLWMSKETAGTSTYANTSVRLAALRDRMVNALSLGGLEVKIGTAGNCKTLLGERGQTDQDKEQFYRGTDIFLSLRQGL